MDVSGGDAGMPGSNSPQPRGWRRKLRFDRGPLRWWLVVAGVILVRHDPLHYCIGSLLVLAGVALHFVSKACLAQNFQLTVSGPYRFSRNPFYLANLLAECGILVIVGSPWLAGIYLVLWAFIYDRTIRSEEATLAELFGESFSGYCGQVPRLIPRPWKFLQRTEVSGPRFSLMNPNIFGGAELHRSLRLASYPLLLLGAGMLRDGGWVALSNPTGPEVLAFAGFVLLNTLGLISRRLLSRAASAVVESDELPAVPAQAA